MGRHALRDHKPLRPRHRRIAATSRRRPVRQRQDRSQADPLLPGTLPITLLRSCTRSTFPNFARKYSYVHTYLLTSKHTYHPSIPSHDMALHHITLCYIAHIYIYIYRHIYIYIYILIVYVYVNFHAYTHVLYSCTCTYACKSVCAYACIHVCMYYICMYVRMYVCMYVCMYVRVCI